MFACNNPDLALKVIEAGVDRIWIDLELDGKKDRQGANTRISNHEISDISKIRKVIKAPIIVRINPINKNSYAEIRKVVENGADIVMLPMFCGPREVEYFLKSLKGDAKANLLFETKESFARMPLLMNYCEVDEVYLGLNDLHRGLNLKFMFEILAFGLVDLFVSEARKNGKIYGFGGITKLGSGRLKSELILAEHSFFKSDLIIISRELQEVASNSIGDFKTELTALKDLYKKYLEYDISFFNKNRATIIREVSKEI